MKNGRLIMKNSKHIFKYLFIVLLSISSCLASMCSVFSMQEKSKGISKKSPSHAQNAQSVSVNNSIKHKRDETNNKTNDEENRQQEDPQPPRKKQKIIASDDMVPGNKENAPNKKRKRQPDLADKHTTTTSTTTTTTTISQSPKRQKKLLPKKEYIITVSIDGKPPQTISLASIGTSTPLGKEKIAQYLYWSASQDNVENVQKILDFLQKKLISKQLDTNTFDEIINDFFIPEKEFIDEDEMFIMNALSRACIGGYVDIVRLLITNGANANFANRFGLAPLLFAACTLPTCTKHVKIVQCLVTQGKATVNVKDPVTLSTPLHIASNHGHVEIVQYLVNKGANINATDRGGCTPLHSAVELGHFEAVRWLVQEGNASIDTANECGETPLHYATYDGDVKTIQCLVANGANVYATNKKNKTAYQIALKKRGPDHEITRLLAARAQEVLQAVTAHSIGEAFIRRLVLPKMYPKKEWLKQEEAQPAKQNELNALCKSIQDKSIEGKPAKSTEKAGHMLDCRYDTKLVDLVYEFLYPKPARSNQKSDCKKT